ncbi:MAG: tRNA (adenosine(37)-N6)-threonylcarbamoyltransferase complex ATPase subunit type 1 TsaE [Rikenellaceae bacterium]
MIKISINSLDQLSEVAEAILKVLNGRTVVLLDAQMGGGKTTLVRAIAASLGSEDNVTSPTFAIVNEYRTAQDHSIFHFDMYRIERIAEAIDLGFEEYIHSGELCFIEWAERVEPLLPDDAMMVRIEVLGESERCFIIDAI